MTLSPARALSLFSLSYWRAVGFGLEQVDSAREHGILLEAVQVLTDLNLCIRKAYIASDGKWFMDGTVSIFLLFQD